MNFNELQSKLWSNMLTAIDNFRSGKIPFSNLISEIGAALDVGEYDKISHELFEQLSAYWEPLFLLYEIKEDNITYEDFHNELSVLEKFLKSIPYSMRFNHSQSRFWVDMIQAIVEYRKGELPFSNLVGRLETDLYAGDFMEYEELNKQWNDHWKPLEIFNATKGDNVTFDEVKEDVSNMEKFLRGM